MLGRVPVLLFAVIASINYSLAFPLDNFGCPKAYSYYQYKKAVAKVAFMSRNEDGSFNNLQHPYWGASGRILNRVAPSAFADYRKFPSGQDRPNPRVISNDVCGLNGESIQLSQHRLSSLFVAWGQFLTHDIHHTPAQEGPEAEQWPIPIPKGDPHFDPQYNGNETFAFTRSIYSKEQFSQNGARQQINLLNSWFDGEHIYGNSKASANKLRTFQSGKIKLNEQGLLNKMNGLFVSGDARVNENIVLIALNTLFVREHNRLCEQIDSTFRVFTDENLYIFCRNYVTALMNKITYDDYLPKLLGPMHSLRPYRGYEPEIEPSITNIFSTAAFRFGHFTIPDLMLKKNDAGQVTEQIPVREGTGNPNKIQTYEDIGELLKGESENIMKKRTIKMSDELRNFLVTLPKNRTMLLDLASLNIQRGRDHGLPDFNTFRKFFGLRPYTQFEQITSNREASQKLKACYKDINLVDSFIGLIAQDSVTGGQVGELGAAIINHSLWRVRAGDRYWYESSFPPELVKEIKDTSLSDIIKRNTQISHLADDCFIVP